MTKLQEYLYQYIMEDRYPQFATDREYIAAQQARDAAREKLTAGLTREQRHLLSRYMDEENYLGSIELQHVFLEALAIVHDIFHLSL